MIFKPATEILYIEINMSLIEINLKNLLYNSLQFKKCTGLEFKIGFVTNSITSTMYTNNCLIYILNMLYAITL